MFTIIIVLYYLDYKCRRAVDDSFLKAKTLKKYLCSNFAVYHNCNICFRNILLSYQGRSQDFFLPRLKNPMTFFWQLPKNLMGKGGGGSYAFFCDTIYARVDCCHPSIKTLLTFGPQKYLKRLFSIFQRFTVSKTILSKLLPRQADFYLHQLPRMQLPTPLHILYM